VVKHIVAFAFVVILVACAPQAPPAGLQAVRLQRTWNQAREFYFHAVKSPAREYKIDGTKGEIIDVRVYPCPRPELLLVTFGETYHDTTGWEIHVLLMRTNDIPTYPGNVYLCPLDTDFALDWLQDDTLSIYYPAGHYPDVRDFKTGTASKSPSFQYEKKVAGITVRFIPADRAVMEAKQEAMRARAIGHEN
jgi:hypothetical protein